MNNFEKKIIVIGLAQAIYDTANQMEYGLYDSRETALLQGCIDYALREGLWSTHKSIQDAVHHAWPTVEKRYTADVQARWASAMLDQADVTGRFPWLNQAT